ncbi:MAG TPA: hypothetical protein VE464_05405 [Streptosporangiaceae bacterium]|nr:hypothetical protein [Streptosporangiaceae bacterium]
MNDDDGLALALDVGGTTIKAGDRGGVIGAALLARDGWAPES